MGFFLYFLPVKNLLLYENNGGIKVERFDLMAVGNDILLLNNLLHFFPVASLSKHLSINYQNSIFKVQSSYPKI